MAKNIYLALNEEFPSNTFYNIASKLETNHISLVQDLVKKYDLNITNLADYKENYSQAQLESFDAGVTDIEDFDKYLIEVKGLDDLYDVYTV